MLDHVPRDRHAGLLARVHEWLEPGGLLLFSVEVEEAADAVAKWLDVPMFFSCFDAETTLRLTREAGFDVLRSDREAQLEGERELEWLRVLARRPS